MEEMLGKTLPASFLEHGLLPLPVSSFVHMQDVPIAAGMQLAQGCSLACVLCPQHSVPGSSALLPMHYCVV